MLPVLVAQSSLLQYPLGILLFLISLFLILLILVQRGRGGGLTGALGGMGGQSAFGSKTGDVFTKVTVITASVWILLCLLIIGLFDVGGFAPTRGGRGAASRDRADIEAAPADLESSRSINTTNEATNPAGGSTTTPE